MGYSLMLIGFIIILIKNYNKINEFVGNNDKEIIFDLFVYIIITFGFLVYLEIIELDFCNLNYNLKRNITIRSIEDYELKSENGEDIGNNLNDSFNSFKIFINN